MRRGAVAFAVAFALATPSVAQARGCTEVSDVTGEKKCSRFGALWSLEGTAPVLFRFGMRYSEMTTEDLAFGATKTKGENGSIPYRVPGRSLGFRALNGVGLDGGLGFFVWGQLYTGFESHLSLGQVTTRETTVRSQGQSLRLTQDDGVNAFTYGAAIPIGYRIPLGRAALRPEVACGFDMVDITQKATLANGRSWTGSAIATRGLVEPRLAGEIWFTQHIAFSVTAGINLIGGNTDHSLGLSLAWHHRAFDGASAF